ncbi:MAG: tolB protein precursor [Myxococcales bacterium]|nr:tolB protein precursor [Myxococcales bacterium]
MVLVVLGMSWQGCSCSHNAGNNGDGGDLDMSINPDAIAGGDLIILPKDVTLDLQAGGSAPSQSYTAATLAGADVTAMTTFTVDDTTLGSFSGATFTASGAHGGTTFVRGTFQGMTGYATLHVKLHASVPSDNCPGCPAFPASGTPACTVTAATPTVLYPNDGTLVPPNMNVLETQFDQGTGNTLFEIDYENAATDVRVLTMCTPIKDSKGGATNGCAYDLSQQVWDFIAQSNRGGDPLDIIVRATDASGSCIATSSSQVRISFGQDDLNGGIYYWQSVAVTGLQGATGGIFRYDFGKRGQTPQPFLAPTASGGTMQRCIGCHFLSRDGQKMTYGNDDPDADDEYGDLKVNLLDVATKNAIALTTAGFQAFAPDHSRLLASNGVGKGTVTNFFLFDGTTGAAATPATVSSGAARGTQPDYSADGSRVVFTQASNFSFTGNNRIDDNHFSGGSLFVMSASGNTFGTPSALLTSAGENNYYPAFSPDGAFVIFNRVPLTGMPGACTANSCPNDAFSNPNARVMLMPSGGGAAVDLANINGSGALANSWPRFAPTVQTYKGDQIAWVTFSSTRDYGDVVRNSVPVGGMPQHLCYPPESPENTSTNKNVTTDPICLQPQLWMAAINLSKGGGLDPSYPAFWLPFQDPTAHNHIAQWVVSLVGPPPPPADGGVSDGGSCIPDGVTCTSGSGVCCNGVCCANGTCGCIP